MYNTFPTLPDFYEEGGADGAFGDYFRGIVTAPSTFAGLFLPGLGKAGGVAATQAAKLAVNKAITSGVKNVGIKQGLKNTLKGGILTKSYAELAKRPILASSIVEASGAALQNVAMQKTEQEIGVREKGSNALDINYLEAGAYGALGAATNAALAVSTAKVFGGKAVGLLGKSSRRTSGDMLGEATDSLLKKNKKAVLETEKLMKKNAVLSNRIIKDLRPLDVNLTEAGDVVEKGLRKKLFNKTDAIPDFVISLDSSRSKRIFGAIMEIMHKGATDGRRSTQSKQQFILKKGERITEGVARILRTQFDNDADKVKFLTTIYKKYNLSGDDFANFFMANVSNAAKTLQSASSVAKLVKSIDSAGDDIFGMGKEAKETLLKMKNLGDARELLDVAKTGETKQTFIRQLDQMRLSFMTSQVATTYRNTISGYSRIGFDAATKLLDRTIATILRGTDKLTGFKASSGKVSLLDYKDLPNDDSFSVLLGLANGHETEAIETMFRLGFDKQATTLFRELRDIADASGSMSGKAGVMRNISRDINALNTISDNYFKRIAFSGSLKRQLNEMYVAKRDANKLLSKKDKNYVEPNLLREKYNIVDIVKRGKFTETFQSKEGKNALGKAIEDALYFTYQKTPDGNTAKLMINLMHKAPFLTTSFMPFPRFVANALRFTYEYSPLYIFQGAARSFAKDANNYEEVAKSLVGLGAFAGAIAYRENYGGDNWWEGKTPSGRTFDLRPFFPAAPYLYFADLYLRMKNEDPVLKNRGKDFIKESAQALTGTQMRAGMGLWAFDNAMEDFSKGSFEGLLKLGGKGVGNIVNTFTIPLTFPQDVYNTFLAPDEARIVYNSKSSDLLSHIVNRSIARIPGNKNLERLLSEKIGTKVPEPLESAFVANNLRREIPITRQTFGLLLQSEKSFIEKEIIRLKMNPNVLKSRTGIPEADQLYNQFRGEYASQYLSPVLEKDEYYLRAKKENNVPEQRRRLLEIKQRHMDYVNELVIKYARKKIKDKSDPRVIEGIDTLPLTKSVERYGFNPIEQDNFEKFNQSVREEATEMYKKNHGKPSRGSPYNYRALIYYATKIKERNKLREQKSIFESQGAVGYENIN